MHPVIVFVLVLVAFACGVTFSYKVEADAEKLYVAYGKLEAEAKAKVDAILKAV